MRLLPLAETAVAAAALAAASSAGAAERIVDLPTRPGVTERLLVVVSGAAGTASR